MVLFSINKQVKGYFIFRTPQYVVAYSRIVGKGMKVRSVPISNILMGGIQDWFAFRAEMAKRKPHVEESPYVFYSQRSPKFTVRGIQTMIEGYSLPNKKLTPHMFVILFVNGC
jgi:site-specific recombinase XerD